MDMGIGRATTSYLANYPQPSYATPHVTNFLASYATGDIHSSAPHLHVGHSRIDENSTGAHVASSSTVAYDTSHVHLQNFGNTSSPKEAKSIGGNLV